jgi:hypothetical protein
MGRRRERHKPADPTSDRIAMALEMIRRSDEHWHGLAVWGDAIERYCWRIRWPCPTAPRTILLMGIRRGESCLV